jgi:hypothetical protein
MDHRLPEILGIRPPMPLSIRDAVSGAVILYDDRMIHGNIGRTLLEIADRVTTGFH